MDPEKQLFEEIKIRFNRFVRDACDFYREIGYPIDTIPEIKYIEHEAEHIFVKPCYAEIDVINKIIFVNVNLCRGRSLEDMRKTAYHEVTHLVELEHGKKFFDFLDTTLTIIFKPINPQGIYIHRGGTPLPVVKSKPPEPDLVHCNYHLCKKEGKLLVQCPWCKNYYCQSHIRPKEPHPYEPKKPDYDFTGHPCSGYNLFEMEDLIIKAIYDPISKRKLIIHEIAKQAYKKQEEKDRRKCKLEIEMENSQAIICPRCTRKFHYLTNEQYRENAEFKIVKWTIVPQWNSDGSIQCPHCKEFIIPDKIVD